MHMIFPISTVDDDGEPYDAMALAQLAVHRVNLILEHLSNPDAELQEPTHQTYARIAQLEARIEEMTK